MRQHEKWIADAARRFGLSISRTSSQPALPVEATDQDRAAIAQVRPYTMTSQERIWVLMQAVRYVERLGLKGDFVECGVWRGGSVMTMAAVLMESPPLTRHLWLYDTYSGMTEPTASDIAADSGKTAQQMLAETPVGDGDNIWCVASLDDVRANMASTGFPDDLTHYVQGPVEQTLYRECPSGVALMRLDTDWYESTKVSLEVLYPRLVPGGVCILDDYGHWQGARKAVDEFFHQRADAPLMMPIDFSGRIFIKPHDLSDAARS